MSNFIILLALYFSVLASQRVGETIISDLWNNCTLRPSDNRNLTFTSLSFFPVLINAFTVVIRELTRFLIINGIDGLPVNEFNKEHILNFRDFLRKEYTLVEKFPELYAEMNKRNIPSKERSQNTIAEKLLLLQAFMVELESNDGGFYKLNCLYYFVNQMIIRIFKHTKS